MKRDRYFTIRYMAKGVTHEEGLGWMSEGWTGQKVALVLARLRTASKVGQGPARLEEARELAREKRQAKAALEEASVTFRRYLEDLYVPAVEGHKAAGTVAREKGLAERWAYPELADLRLSEITPFHVEKVKKRAQKAEKSSRTVQYILAVIRQVFRHARDTGAYEGEIPTARVKLPRFDNRAFRYLTRGEAAALLHALQHGLEVTEKDGTRRHIEGSATVAALALISLHGGLRAGEVLGLTWADVDLEAGVLLLFDTKSGATAGATMSDDVRALFAELEPGEPSSPVFQNRFGRAYRQVPRTFETIVKGLGLNKGVTDRRRRVTFHTLRHTFASWLAEDGTDLYLISKLLRHATISQTERYSHLAKDAKARAVRATFKKRRHLEVVKAE